MHDFVVFLIVLGSLVAGVVLTHFIYDNCITKRSNYQEYPYDVERGHRPLIGDYLPVVGNLPTSDDDYVDEDSIP